jgi:hypothetical protein
MGAFEVEERPEIPEWVPEKFRSNPEALGKSYTELESRWTRDSQEKKHLAEVVAEQQAQLEQYQQLLADDEIFDDEDPATLNPLLSDPLSTMAWLASEAANRAVAFERASSIVANPQQNAEAFEDPETLSLVLDAQMAAQYPDWYDRKNEVLDRVTEYNLLPDEMTSPAGFAAGLNAGYQLVAGQHAQQELAFRRIQEQNRWMKHNAQTLTGAGTRAMSQPADDDEAFFERIQAAYACKPSSRLGGGGW